MGMVRITLFDFDLKKDEAKEPIAVELEYADNMSLEEQGTLKIAITAGNDVGSGTVTLPFHMMSALVAQVMAEHAKRNTPSIIMPNRDLIKPN